MAWKVELSSQALKALGQLDGQVTRRILTFLHERVAPLDDPRSIGEALKGSRLGEFWKYRIGDYRVISSIEDGALRILVTAARSTAKALVRRQGRADAPDRNGLAGWHDPSPRSPHPEQPGAGKRCQSASCRCPVPRFHALRAFHPG